jgi:hypothetical protein
MAAADPIAKVMEGLDYPGRRKPVNRDRQPPPVDTPVWDARPTVYIVDGEKREFYFIGALAKALGYSVQSIRAWEGQGLLPNTPFRSPRTKRPVAGGRSNKGKRLWTHEQIEGILRLAKKHKVILNKQPPTPAFAKEVAHFFNQLVSDHPQ